MSQVCMTGAGQAIRTFPLVSFPEELTHCPGLVGEIVDYTVSTSRRPNRALALGAAVALVGTLAGRGAAGPTDSSTTLYVINSALTGGGKDRPLKVGPQLLRAAGFPELTGPGEFMSHTAVIRTLEKKPGCLVYVDEFRSVLKKLLAPKGNPHEKMILTILRSLWSANISPYGTQEWATTESKTISSPALAILAATTPQEFTSALTSAEAENGTLNRFLLIEVSRAPSEQNLAQDVHSVPQRLVDQLRQVRMHCHAERDIITTGKGILNQFIVADDKPKLRLDWGDGAEEVYKSIPTLMERHLPGAAEFTNRTAEQAARLATIRAVGELRSQVIREDMLWGAEFAVHSTRNLHQLVTQNIAENAFQASAKEIEGIIRKEGPGGIWRKILSRKLNSKYSKSQIDMALESLADGEKIMIEKIETPGRSATLFRHTAPQLAA